MSEFLFGEDLSTRIRSVVAGANPRLSVAFWGRSAAKDLFEDEQALRRAQIICDVSMGGTHPDALTNLLAPKNAQLKHIPGLHAKVWLSDKGMVVGSANASNNGIGFAGGPPNNLEAGVYYAAGSDAWETASNWFNTHFNTASQVDDAAVDWARKSWRKPPPSIPPKADSILDAIRLAPDRYRDLAFFFEKVLVTKDEAHNARSVSRKTTATASDIATIEGCGQNDIFTGLTPQQVEQTSPLFLEFCKPDSRTLKIFARHIVYRDPRNGILFAKRNATKLAASRPDLPRLSDAARIDDIAASRILNPRPNGVRFLTPASLVTALEQSED